MPTTFNMSVQLAKAAIDSKSIASSEAHQYIDNAVNNHKILEAKYKELEKRHYETMKRVAAICGYHKQ